MPVRLVCVLLLSAVGGAFAHDDEHGDEPKAVDPKVLAAPTAVPDRIILTFQDDPATSMAVTWRTDAATTRAFGQIAEAEPGPLFVNRMRQVKADTTETLAGDLGEANYHSLSFTGLKPKTKYVYRVGDGTNWSEFAQFATASDEAEPFTFVYFGDAQNDVKSHWSRVIREAVRDAPRMAFMLHAGDLINRSDADAEWGEWHYAGGWTNTTIPSVMTPGNHEYNRRKGHQLSDHWRPGFALPQNGPEGLEETVYWFDHQGVRFVSLNSNERMEEQVPWLEKVLRDNPNSWTVATFHHPIYSAAKDRDNPELRVLWQPVFDQHGVDLALQGHDHTYMRSGLISENTENGVNTRDRSGTVYVVSVSGPKMYALSQEFKTGNIQRTAEDTQLYQIITVDGDTLTYDARSADGRPYDGFTLVKRDGQPNEMTERIPETSVPVPQRRRPATREMDEQPSPAAVKRESAEPQQPVLKP